MSSIKRHFVARYVGPENKRSREFFILGETFGGFFGKPEPSESGVKYTDRLETSELSVKVAFDRTATELGYSSLHEIDIFGGSPEHVDLIEKIITAYYQSCGFVITSGYDFRTRTR